MFLLLVVVQALSPKGFATPPQTKKPLPDKFHIMFTCGQCDTRNLLKVSKVSWENGVVIGKCWGCGAQHMLADNRGLTDETNTTKFSDALNDMRSRGLPANKLTVTSMDQLKDLGLEMTGGNLSLVARDDEKVVRTSTVSPSVISTQPLDPQPYTFAQHEANRRRNMTVSDLEDINQVTGDMAIQVTNDPAELEGKRLIAEGDMELVAEEPIAYRLPKWVEPGDVIQLEGPQNSVLHCLIPEDARTDMMLMVEGAVEVPVPEGMHEGEFLGVQRPDGVEVPVLLDATTCVAGTIVSVGWPVTLGAIPVSFKSG